MVKILVETQCRLFICSLDIFPSICNFYIDEFCHTLSDVHESVCLSLMCQSRKYIYEQNNRHTKEENVRLWDSRNADQFIKNVDCQMHLDITAQLSCMAAAENISQANIDEVVEK